MYDDVPRPDADGWCGTKLTSTERYYLNLSRLQCSGASSRAAIMKDYELAGETSLQASRCTSKRTWRSANKHADCSATHTPFACTEFVLVHATLRTAPWSRKLSSANLKNDYESEKINLQDSKHAHKKSDDQHSEYEDEEETYAHHKETLCNKMCPRVRLFINYALCQECNNYQQLKRQCI